MKRLIITALVLALLLQNVSAPLPSLASEITEETTTENISTENSSVISEELQEAFLTEAESYRVMIWMDDIDYDKVEAMAEKATDTTWEEIESYEKQVYLEAVTEVARAEMEKAGVMTAATLRTEEEIMADSYAEVLAVADEELKLVAEEVDSFIMAKRAASTALYAENNKAIASNSLIKGNIEFVSRYSPMIIAELSKEQIEAIAEEEGVVGIYLSEEEENSEHTDTGISVCAPNIYTPSDEEYDYYLEYLDANQVHSMGLSGEGVKVGLLDNREVYISDHSELSNSNLHQIGGTPIYGDNHHQVLMARIICGSVGVAPGCELYTISMGYKVEDNSYEEVELLLDEGVSVINLSQNLNNIGTNAYGAIEMWYDHISVSHGVSVVTSSGNETSRTPISKPGLAYNVITVGNVDPWTDTLDVESAYIDDSVVQKPDVVSAGTTVLDNNKGGTSAATATVTGMIALMIEANPTLAAKPTILKAIVIASADHIAGSDWFAAGYNEQQGAGVVNVLRAINIVNRRQYLEGYISANGTYSKTVTVPYAGNEKSTFVFAGNKMNISTTNHEQSGIDNQDMPQVSMVLFNSSGTGLNGHSMMNSSVQLVRIPYNSSVEIKLSVNSIGSRGLPYALAWY